MASQAARRLVSVTPLDGDRVEATFVLECGCEVTRELPADRVLDVDGGRLLVGKYPCPERHPVAARK
jgi:hypothetical protein